VTRAAQSREERRLVRLLLSASRAAGEVESRQPPHPDTHVSGGGETRDIEVVTVNPVAQQAGEECRLYRELERELTRLPREDQAALLGRWAGRGVSVDFRSPLGNANNTARLLLAWMTSNQPPSDGEPIQFWPHGWPRVDPPSPQVERIWGTRLDGLDGLRFGWTSSFVWDVNADPIEEIVERKVVKSGRYVTDGTLELLVYFPMTLPADAERRVRALTTQARCAFERVWLLDAVGKLIEMRR
jgi:hypothetical protein